MRIRKDVTHRKKEKPKVKDKIRIPLRRIRVHDPTSNNIHNYQHRTDNRGDSRPNIGPEKNIDDESEAEEHDLQVRSVSIRSEILRKELM